ncbi:DUF354 domain-containing protein [bacterium]|nr:DUF354 domain-containing protein [bacterium]
MRILFEITHPKHAHLFRNAIIALRKQGHVVAITAREKDVTIQLLKSWQNDIGDFSILSKQDKPGLIRLAKELILRDYRLFKFCRKFNPDILVARVGPSATHVGYFLKKPVIVFEDTDDACLQQWISFPFATRVCTAKHYKKNWGKKHVRYNSFDEMAYLHPNRFSPDETVVRDAGLIPGEYIIVRLVSWQATHDINQKGIQSIDRIRLINKLQQYRRVVISSETAIPAEFEQLRLPVDSHLFHHILAFACLTMGESSTVATEGAMLGVPGILINTMKWSSINRLQDEFGLVFQTDNSDQAIEVAEKWLNDKDAAQKFRDRTKKLLSVCVDLTAWMLEIIDLN